jgi:HPt (histidine-containing phosphotransfer) domain-containing protein
MTTSPAIQALAAELEAALRLDKPAGVRVARAVAAATAAEKSAGAGAALGRSAGSGRDAARMRDSFWALVAEVKRVGGSRASADGMIAALAQAIEDARDALSEAPDASR